MHQSENIGLKTKSRNPLLSLILGGLFLTIISTSPAMARPAIVFDSESEIILYSEDADQLWHPASLTKLMTAYMVFEALKANKVSMNSLLINSAYARSQPPSKIGLPLKATIKLKKALEILMVKSANDVAVMIAEKISGSAAQFAQEMTQTAKRLGMRNTRFYNPHGLPHPKQVTTARDMAILAKALIDEYPEHSYFFSLPSVKVGKRRMRSHNDLLRTFEGTDGMKTGFICASGYNIVVSATRDDRRLVAVVLGARSVTDRRKRATQLLLYGFQNYNWKTLFPSKITQVAVGTNLINGPVNLRSTICNRRPVKRRISKKRKRKKKKTVKKSKKKKVAAKTKKKKAKAVGKKKK